MPTVFPDGEKKTLQTRVGEQKKFVLQWEVTPVGCPWGHAWVKPKQRRVAPSEDQGPSPKSD